RRGYSGLWDGGGLASPRRRPPFSRAGRTGAPGALARRGVGSELAPTRPGSPASRTGPTVAPLRSPTRHTQRFSGAVVRVGAAGPGENRVGQPVRPGMMGT